jgi:hypothetical protein
VKVELSRFRVRRDKSERVDEWLGMLNDNMAEALTTLDREQMKVEVVFREVIDGEEYLYWFSVQDERGESAHGSPFAVDREHLAFHEECIDHEYGRRDAQPQVVLVPPDIARVMQWEDPAASRTEYQR